MPKTVSGINEKILVWARQRSGMTVAQVAKATGRDVSVIDTWESGESAPTYPQLEELAYRVYKRPIALFFFPAPPTETDPEHSFRTLPDLEIKDLAADTRFKIRHARAMQLALYELHDGANPADRKIFRDIDAQAASPAKVAAIVRDYLGIDADVQRRAWKTPDDAVKWWRTAIEDAGVYVFKNTFKQENVSGFCLYDAEFPLIYVNNSTAKTRQSFTILHELGHLLFGTGGVTKRDDHYIDSLKGEQKEIEVFCNRFAAESLLPTRLVKAEMRSVADDDIARLAATYKVSRQVVLTRLVALGAITQAHYEKKAAQWKADYEAQQSGKGGGQYYATQGAYLGDRFLRLAFSRYYDGRISVERLAEVLNANIASLPGLEQVALAAGGNE